MATERSSEQSPPEKLGREAYYDAALVSAGLLTCDGCSVNLDADEHLGPGISFESDGWYLLLGDEAYRRGWRIKWHGDNYFEFQIYCPECTRDREFVE